MELKEPALTRRPKHSHQTEQSFHYIHITGDGGEFKNRTRTLLLCYYW